MLRGSSALRSAGLSAENIHYFAGDDAAANVMVISTISDKAQKLTVKEAFATSLQDMWILYTCISFLERAASAFVKRRELSKEHVETRTGLKRKRPPLFGNERLGRRRG